MRDVNSLNVLMIARDNHDSALSAAPKPRHHLQELFRKTVKYQSDNERYGMIHNHPSGDPTPSMADIEMTKKVIDAGLRLGIGVHDHIIVGRKGHFGFRPNGLL